MACHYYDPSDSSNFTVAMPRLTFGRGSLAELGARTRILARDRGVTGVIRVALVTDPHLLPTSILRAALSSLRAAQCEVAIFSELCVEADDLSVADAARFLRDARPHVVVSVGGGSVIDTAKAAMVVARYETPVNEYFAPPMGAGKSVPGPLWPHIACPTTSGTGSECTPVSVLRLTALRCKFVFASAYMLPDVAIVDPACTDALPRTMAASTGFDALSHALECYTAKPYCDWEVSADPRLRPSTQGANPWSDLLAKEVLSLCGQYLIDAVEGEQQARDKMSWAATLAGIAFGHAGTHLPHAMSYGITHLMSDIETADYPQASPFIPHGISVAVSLPAIVRFTAPGAPMRHQRAAQLLGATLDSTDPNASGALLSARLIELMAKTGLPNGLLALGFDASDLPALTESSMRQGRAIGNAPRLASSQDMQEMYRQALQHW